MLETPRLSNLTNAFNPCLHLNLRQGFVWNNPVLFKTIKNQLIILRRHDAYMARHFFRRTRIASIFARVGVFDADF